MIHTECRTIQNKQIGHDNIRSLTAMYCKDHQVDICNCLKDWADHNVPSTEEYIRENRKDNCILCDSALTPTDERYLLSGNCCPTCSARLERAAKAKKPENVSRKRIA